LSLIKVFWLALLLGLLALGAPVRSEPLNIYFKTSPRFELLRPFSDSVTLSILVTRSDGRPLDRGVAKLRLDAPRPNRIFSTDFPIVEGTRLFDLNLPLKAGRAELKYMFPIRGVYRLAVDISSEGATMATQNLEFKVRENGRKWLFLSMFLVLLFAIGWIAGRIFSGLGPAAAKMVLLLAGAAIVCFAHAQPGASQSADALLEIRPATVGKLTHVTWRLPEQLASAAGTAALTLSIFHLEKEKTLFAVERLPVQREFSMDLQFFDGAEYRITALAEVSGRAPIRSEQRVSVTGIEPPPTAMIPALILFVAVMAAGLGAGRWSKLRGAAP
jgi:hypothetical protein